MLPAGSVLLTHPVKGKDGIVGRIIAQRIGVPYSHSAVALGNGFVWESTWKWTKITPEWTWVGKGDAWAPVHPLTEEQQRVGRAIAYFTEGRIKYDLTNLTSYMLRGVPAGRGHGMWCSDAVAEWWLTVADYDFSGCRKPYLVTPADLLEVMQASPDWVRVPIWDRVA